MSEFLEESLTGLVVNASHSGDTMEREASGGAGAVVFDMDSFEGYTSVNGCTVWSMDKLHSRQKETSRFKFDPIRTKRVFIANSKDVIKNTDHQNSWKVG